MKTTELLNVLTTPDETEEAFCTTEESEEEECCYDDDDFWEAIDLLETSRKSMRAVLRLNEDLTQSRRRLLENLCDDISVFVGHFVDEVKE